MNPASNSPRLRRKRLALGALAAMLFASLAVAALAAHWPQHGGDAGRSGYQPVDEISLPVTASYAKTGESEKNVRTSIITTAGGGTGTPRMVYGTDNPDPLRARVQLQRLDNGAEVGIEAGVPIDDVGDDTDTFGSGVGNVTPVDTSDANTFGNVFAIHNDDNQNLNTSDPRRGGDIALAQIRTVDGTKGQSIGTNGDVSLGDQTKAENPNTIHFTVNSSPALYPEAGGTRTIYFTGSRPAVTIDPAEIPCAPGVSFETPPPQGNELLRGCQIDARRSIFKVTISDANTENATITAFQMSANISNLNTTASPTVVNLDVDGTGPNPAEPYIAVSTTDGFVRTYKASDLSAGPASADLGDQAETPSVPVSPNGTTPAVAPAIFVAVREAGTGAGAEDTFVHRLTLNEAGTALEFDAATGRSFDLAGNPTPGLAVTKEAGSAQPGRVIVLTTAGVFSLNSDDLRSGTSRIPATAPAHTRTVPAASGNLAFWADDAGDQHVADATTLEDAPETAGGFQENAANTPAEAGSSFGQPSIAFRFVQFGSDQGAFVYRGSPFVAAPGSIGISVGDATVKEGDSGTTTATFTLTKTGTNAARVTVRTADGTATAGEDYVAMPPAVVEFGDAETTKTVTVAVNGDTTPESDEFFKLQLSDPSGGVVITDSEGAGIIQNDDGPTGSRGVLLVSDQVVTEGDAGDVAAVFTVSLTSPSAQTVTVRYGTANRTATGGADFTPVSGTVTFAPGEQVKTFTVPVKSDFVRENVEQFFVGLANAQGADIADQFGIGTIVDDDGPPASRLRQAPGLTLKVSPRRDLRAPFRFTSSGRLRVPSQLPRAKGCQGRVSIQVKAGSKTISTRRTKVRRDCRYRSRVTFRERDRFTGSGVLRFRARYLGSPWLKPSRSRRVRAQTER